MYFDYYIKLTQIFNNSQILEINETYSEEDFYYPEWGEAQPLTNQISLGLATKKRLGFDLISVQVSS